MTSICIHCMKEGSMTAIYAESDNREIMLGKESHGKVVSTCKYCGVLIPAILRIRRRQYKPIEKRIVLTHDPFEYKADQEWDKIYTDEPCTTTPQTSDFIDQIKKVHNWLKTH